VSVLIAAGRNMKVAMSELMVVGMGERSIQKKLKEFQAM
jgi:hypothetical protein